MYYFLYCEPAKNVYGSVESSQMIFGITPYKTLKVFLKITFCFLPRDKAHPHLSADVREFSPDGSGYSDIFLRVYA